MPEDGWGREAGLGDHNIKSQRACLGSFIHFQTKGSFSLGGAAPGTQRAGKGNPTQVRQLPHLHLSFTEETKSEAELMGLNSLQEPQ